MRSPVQDMALGVLSVATVVALMSHNTARACGPIECTPSAFLPASGSTPGNALEFLWRPASSGRQPGVSAVVHLYKLEGDQRIELATEIVAGRDGFRRVRPREQQPMGTELVLETEEPSCVAGAMKPAMVSVSANSPKPTQLGKLEVARSEARTSMHLPSSGGVCSDDFQVGAVHLKVSLDTAAQPFESSMQHALLIDGAKRPQRHPTPPRGSYPSFELAGRLEDVLYTLCEPRSDSWIGDLPAGTHRVQWVATLPDDTELRSNEITIDLQCDRSASSVRAMDAAAGGTAKNEADPRRAAAGGTAANLPADSQAADGCAVSAARGDGPRAWLFAIGLTCLLCRRRRARAR